MPVPLMVNITAGLTVMVNGLAPKLNVIPLTSVAAVIDTAVVLERANVAVSDEPLGTVPDDQFVPVFQLTEPGLRSHVPLPAKVAHCIESKSKVAVARSNDVCGFLEKLNLVFILDPPLARGDATSPLGADVGKVRAPSQAFRLRCGV